MLAFLYKIYDRDTKIEKKELSIVLMKFREIISIILIKIIMVVKLLFYHTPTNKLFLSVQSNAACKKCNMENFYFQNFVFVYGFFLKNIIENIYKHFLPLIKILKFFSHFKYVTSLIQFKPWCNKQKKKNKNIIMYKNMIHAFS